MVRKNKQKPFCIDCSTTLIEGVNTIKRKDRPSGYHSKCITCFNAYSTKCKTEAKQQDAVDTFFDLDTIAFSNLSCNIRASRPARLPTGKTNADYNRESRNRNPEKYNAQRRAKYVRIHLDYHL